MKSIQVTAPQQLRLVDVPVPEPAPGQALVKMQALSVCGTDMRVYRKPLPASSYPLEPGIPCHECAGTIVKSRAPGWKEGQRVIYLPRLNLNGGAQYTLAEPRDLVALPPDGDIAEWLMCQPWGTVLFALERIGPVAGKRVVVLGQGSVGLLFTSELRNMNARQLITIDPIDHRLEVSRRLGAHLVINPTRQDPVEAVAEATDNRGADLVIEASGDPQALDWAIQMARMYATVVLFGIPEDDRMNVDYFAAQKKQLMLLSAVSATCEDPARPVRWAVDIKCKQGSDLSWLITHRCSFEDASKAYDLYSRRADGVLKPVMLANQR